MSIGNLKDYGNKGNNFPWQLKMLLGLQGVIDALGGSGTGQARTPSVTRTTAVTTNLLDVYSFSVANVGTGNGSAQGATIKPGEILNFDAGGMNNYFPSNTINVDGSGTELLVTWITA